MFFNFSIGFKRAIWPATGIALAVLCANSAWANGVIAPARRFDGGRLSVQTQTGSNCSSSAPDRAGISAATGVKDRAFDGGYGNGSQDLVSGIAITIPFGGPKFGDCSSLLKLEEARNKIDLAVTLFEAGALSAEEFKAVMEEAKSALK